MVAVLFAREDSIYKSMPGLDVYDIKRDARTYDGSEAVIAHPPCRAWGKLRSFAKPREGEKELALFAVDVIRKNGGVLEHPESSSLWGVAGLPKPCADRIEIDQFGGWTFPISQNWFGHKARKNTWLYIVGVLPMSIPDFPLFLGEAEYLVTYGPRCKPWKKAISLADREHTPPEFAKWLVELSKRCRV